MSPPNQGIHTNISFHLFRTEGYTMFLSSMLYSLLISKSYIVHFHIFVGSSEGLVVNDRHSSKLFILSSVMVNETILCHSTKCELERCKQEQSVMSCKMWLATFPLQQNHHFGPDMRNCHCNVVNSCRKWSEAQ